ncbi:MAG: DUF4139 domain-containing protein [Candidatus Aminicenantes bacterium]|nr:DUF4139 domain-containing protein [Candidatus Aminicenantes bacterium]
MNKTRTLAALSIVFCLAAAAPAEDVPLPVLKTRPQTIAVFKNGLGFFIREGEVRLVDGWAVSDSIPQASLGSLWIGALDSGARLEQVVSLKEERSRERAALSIPELFKANVGKRVAFTVDNKLIEGKIKGVLGVSPGPGETAGIYDNRRAALPKPDGGDVVIVETSRGDVAVNKNLVNTVQFLDPPATSVSGTETLKRMKFKVAPARDQARIGLFYLQKGISWTPAYLLNLVDDKKVRMTMQALLMNDVEDFEETDLLFVVGYPHFIFSDILSPLTQDQSLAQFLSALAAGGRRDVSSGSLANIAVQRMSEMEEGQGTGPADSISSSGGGPEGIAMEDLFFYRQPGVSLKKGERALYPIFSELVDYSPIYEWTIPDTASVDSEGDPRRQDEGKTREQVWHSLKLKNSTAYPWTTAPALAVREGKPMAQEILDYTSKGSAVNLKLTIASDVKTSRQEVEAERQRGVTVSGHTYDLVSVRGELRIKNNKDKPVTMDVKKSLTGEVLEVSPQGKTQKMAEGLELRAINPNSRITWEILLNPGQDITLAYKYKIFVSR